MAATSSAFLLGLVTAAQLMATPSPSGMGGPDDSTGSVPRSVFSLSAGSFTVANNVVPRLEMGEGRLLSVSPPEVVAHDDVPFSDIAKDLESRTGDDWLQ